MQISTIMKKGVSTYTHTCRRHILIERRQRRRRLKAAQYNQSQNLLDNISCYSLQPASQTTNDNNEVACECICKARWRKKEIVENCKNRELRRGDERTKARFWEELIFLLSFLISKTLYFKIIFYIFCWPKIEPA